METVPEDFGADNLAQAIAVSAQMDLSAALAKIKEFKSKLPPQDAMRLKQVDAVLEAVYNAKYMLQIAKLEKQRPIAIQQIVDTQKVDKPNG